MNHVYHIFISFLFLSALACSDAAVFSPDVKTRLTSGRSSDTKAESGTDGGQESASTPVVITGAYLTCKRIDTPLSPSLSLACQIEADDPKYFDKLVDGDTTWSVSSESQTPYFSAIEESTEYELRSNIFVESTMDVPKRVDINDIVVQAIIKDMDTILFDQSVKGKQIATRALPTEANSSSEALSSSESSAQSGGPGNTQAAASSQAAAFGEASGNGATASASASSSASANSNGGVAGARSTAQGKAQVRGSGAASASASSSAGNDTD